MARKAKYGPYNYERTLGGRNYQMTATVDAFVQATKKRMNALVLQSVQELIEDVQTPVGKGGKMRVDTGFLRASGQVSLTGMPVGESRGRKRTADDPDGPLGQYVNIPVVDLSQWAMGQTIYFGWVAHYAEYREAYDGFLISGIQKWQTIVDSVAKRIQARSTAASNAAVARRLNRDKEV